MEVSFVEQGLARSNSTSPSITPPPPQTESTLHLPPIHMNAGSFLQRTRNPPVVNKPVPTPTTLGPFESITNIAPSNRRVSTAIRMWEARQLQQSGGKAYANVRLPDMFGYTAGEGSREVSRVAFQDQYLGNKIAEVEGLIEQVITDYVKQLVHLAKERHPALFLPHTFTLHYTTRKRGKLDRSTHTTGATSSTRIGRKKGKKKKKRSKTGSEVKLSGVDEVSNVLDDAQKSDAVQADEDGVKKGKKGKVKTKRAKLITKVSLGGDVLRMSGRVKYDQERALYGLTVEQYDEIVSEQHMKQLESNYKRCKEKLKALQDRRNKLPELRNKVLMKRVESRELEREKLAGLTEREWMREEVELNLRDLHQALRMVTRKKISSRQIGLIYKVLELDEQKALTFPIFCAAASLAERLVEIDSDVKMRMENMKFPDTYINIQHYKALYSMLREPEPGSALSLDLLRAELYSYLLSTATFNPHVCSKHEHRMGVRRQVDDVLDQVTDRKGTLTYTDFLLLIPMFLDIHRHFIDKPVA